MSGVGKGMLENMRRRRATSILASLAAPRLSERQEHSLDASSRDDCARAERGEWLKHPECSVELNVMHNIGTGVESSHPPNCVRRFSLYDGHMCGGHLGARTCNPEMDGE